MPQPSAEQSFRDNLSQFRWARGNNDDSRQGQQGQGQQTGANPFSRFYNAIGNGYIPLRSGERSNEEEAYFALSRWERCVDWFVSGVHGKLMYSWVVTTMATPADSLENRADCWALAHA